MISDSVTSFDGSEIRFWSSTAQPSRPLVLIHGWACNAEFWKHQSTQISQDHEVIVLDLAGHGESTAGTRKWSMAEFARDVLAVLEALDADNWVLAGHSMGGAVALEIAKAEPVRTHAVIGVDSFTYDAFYRRANESDIAEIIELYSGDFSNAIFTGMDALFLSNADKELKHWICKSMAASPEPSALASLRGLLRWDVDETLNEVSVPVKNISAGALLNPESLDRLCQRIEFEYMSGVGHFLFLEDLDGFNCKLLNMLTSDAVRG